VTYATTWYAIYIHMHVGGQVGILTKWVDPVPLDFVWFPGIDSVLVWQCGTMNIHVCIRTALYCR
jgi:hypothetical protein